jgi:hypothetical protein
MVMVIVTKKKKKERERERGLGATVNTATTKKGVEVAVESFFFLTLETPRDPLYV